MHASAAQLQVLDSLGTALGPLDAEPVAFVRRQVENFGDAPHCCLAGGGRSAPHRAALPNGALVRCSDDAQVAPGECCHLSDDVVRVEVGVFEVGVNVIQGGDESDKTGAQR